MTKSSSRTAFIESLTTSAESSASTERSGPSSCSGCIMISMVSCWPSFDTRIASSSREWERLTATTTPTRNRLMVKIATARIIRFVASVPGSGPRSKSRIVLDSIESWPPPIDACLLSESSPLLSLEQSKVSSSMDPIPNRIPSISKLESPLTPCPSSSAKRPQRTTGP